MTSKQLGARKKRAKILIAELTKLFPTARCVLAYSSPWELLVAVILSAQCTDKKVNEVTKNLFAKYRNLNDYAGADRVEFERYIKPAGFYRNKAKNILACAKIIKLRFNNQVPKSMEELISLPGVGRKTANVVLGNAFNIVQGIAVDTHVARLSKFFQLTTHSDPNKIEQDLMAIIPKNDWFAITYLLIEYGRNVHKARSKNADQLPIAKKVRGVE